MSGDKYELTQCSKIDIKVVACSAEMYDHKAVNILRDETMYKVIENPHDTLPFRDYVTGLVDGPR